MGAACGGAGVASLLQLLALTLLLVAPLLPLEAAPEVGTSAPAAACAATPAAAAAAAAAVSAAGGRRRSSVSAASTCWHQVQPLSAQMLGCLQLMHCQLSVLLPTCVLATARHTNEALPPPPPLHLLVLLHQHRCAMPLPLARCCCADSTDRQWCNQRYVEQPV